MSQNTVCYAKSLGRTRSADNFRDLLIIRFKNRFFDFEKKRSTPLEAVGDGGRRGVVKP